MKKLMEIKLKTDKDDRVKKYVKYSFWVMMVMWVFSYIITENLALVYGIIQIAVVIFCFVNSIRHLTMYERKGFAITALSLSGFELLLFILIVLVELR